MKLRRILVIGLGAGLAVWLLRGHPAPRPPVDGTASLELFGSAKDHLDEARAALADHDLDLARRALAAATRITPMMERHAPTLGAVCAASIVRQVLELLDAHPELDAVARRAILADADVTLPSEPCDSRAACRAVASLAPIHVRLAIARAAVALE